MFNIRILLFAITSIIIISCSNDDIRNLPPREFNAIAVQSDFNSITFRWTESTDPENSIVRYDIYMAENIDGAEYELIAENLSEQLVADTDVININGENIFINPPENPEFRFAYVATNLTHNTNYKGKIIAFDQEDNKTETYFYSSTLTDNTIPNIINFYQVVYRFNSNIKFSIEDNDYTNHTIEFYLNNDLNNTFNSNESIIEFTFENLIENTSYNGRIVVTDYNGNVSAPFDFTFTTVGDTFTGDLEFSSQEQMDSFGDNNYSHIIGNLTINYSSGFTNFNSLNSLEDISGNVTIISQLYNENPIDGITTLSSIDGNLSIYRSNSSDIFNNLESITGELFLFGSIQNVSNNSAFETLLSVGDLTIFETFQTNVLDGFNSLITINGKLEVLDTQLHNVDFLSSVLEINNGLEFFGNYSLTNLCGLETVINSNGLNGNYSMSENAYNPTISDIQNGNCSQ